MAITIVVYRLFLFRSRITPIIVWTQEEKGFHFIQTHFRNCYVLHGISCTYHLTMDTLALGYTLTTMACYGLSLIRLLPSFPFISDFPYLFFCNRSITVFTSNHIVHLTICLICQHLFSHYNNSCSSPADILTQHSQYGQYSDLPQIFPNH